MNHPDYNSSKTAATRVPKLGPLPTLLSRKEVDALYSTLQAVTSALNSLKVPYIVTGGSLLGAIRQHSILFCDDDIDLAVLDVDGKTYERVRENLQDVLTSDYKYQVKPWEGGDRVRPISQCNNVFLDLFVIRKYQSHQDLRNVIGVKKNGQSQSDDYVDGIINTIDECLSHKEQPFWHFDTRKAIEMWTKEVYADHEMFPLSNSLKMGPVIGISGPRMPVTLLKRAFGDDCFDVYYQSATHKVSSSLSNSAKDSSNRHKENPGGKLKPLVSAGGTWEGGCKMPLEEEHYLPMQPIKRSDRRQTLHNKEQLYLYLDEQTKLEAEWSKEVNKNMRCQCTVYMDGVFDLFHIGHLEALRQCAKLGTRIIIGVTGQTDATGYKRAPIVPEDERVAIIESIKDVDKVICPCPLVVTEEFMNEHKIDLVVHGFANDSDAKRQEEFFKIAMELGKFKRIPYYRGMSTTERIEKIQRIHGEEESNKTHDNCETEDKKSKPQWFGAALAAATGNSSLIPTYPFPLSLRVTIEPHIDKARKRRDEALDAIRKATGEKQYDVVMERFKSTIMECDQSIGTLSMQYKCNLRCALLTCSGFSDDYDLSKIHLSPSGTKDKLLYNFTRNYHEFQQVFDIFVRSICVPHLATLHGNCESFYYQAFPCLRIIQPDEFSIGPHSDVSYGHHPCSINCYIPLTRIGGASSLFIESRQGSEDWHGIEANDYGLIKYFPGGIVLHWTTENKTTYTRASLDFRIIPGTFYDQLQCGGSQPHGQLDVYRKTNGYYSKCVKSAIDGKWIREGPLLSPDPRVGFPWTVKNWDKLLRNSLHYNSNNSLP